MNLDENEIKFIRDRWYKANFNKFRPMPKEIENAYVEYVRHVFKNGSAYSDAIMDYRIALYMIQKSSEYMLEINSYIKRFDKIVDKFTKIIIILSIIALLCSAFGIGAFYFGKSIGYEIGHREGCTIPSPIPYD